MLPGSFRQFERDFRPLRPHHAVEPPGSIAVRRRQDAATPAALVADVLRRAASGEHHSVCAVWRMDGLQPEFLRSPLPRKPIASRCPGGVRYRGCVQCTSSVMPMLSGAAPSLRLDFDKRAAADIAASGARLPPHAELPCGRSGKHGNHSFQTPLPFGRTVPTS